MDHIAVVRRTVVRFCQDFIQHPYLCYTEHGQHALFYTMLFNALPDDQRTATWEDRKINLLQKEYPTSGKLDKPTRQHWDIALLHTPLEAIPGRSPAYDHLQLAAVVEFGMNATPDHLKEDIRRLSHRCAHVRQGFVVHLYRLSPPGEPFSGRDWSAGSGRILKVHDVAELSKGASVEIYHGMVDATGNHEQGLWSIRDGSDELLARA